MVKIGIIIGRFQTPFLTESHLDLFTKVNELSDKVHFILGCNKALSGNVHESTSKINNPFSYEYRQELISYHLQNYENKITFDFIDDCNSDIEWTLNLDRKIKSLSKSFKYKKVEVVIYGSRESFFNKYVGKYPTEVLEVQGRVSSRNIRNMFLTIVS